MKKKLKNIWSAIKWPLIFYLSQICLLMILLTCFQYQKVSKQLSLHPNWSNAKAMEVVETYLNSSAGAKELGQYILSTTWIILLFNIIVLLPIIYHIYKKHRHKFPRYVSNKSRLHIALCAICLALGLNIILMWVSNLFGGSPYYQTPSFDRPILILIISGGIIGPVIEELLFRGIMYDRFQGYLPKYKAGLITTIIFSLLHTNIVQVVYALIMGFYFLYCYDHYENMGANITAHIASNIAVTLLIPFFIEMSMWEVVAIFVVCIFGGMYFLQKIKKGTSIYS